MKNNTIHPDLQLAQKLAYEPLGLHCSAIIPEAESQEYSACRFELNGKKIIFRVAKTTPTKSGQFVTIWKREHNGPIIPFDLADPVDLFVISVRSGENFGQFVFPKDVLVQHGFVSKNNIGGKRAMRVYPPWVITESAQAQKTQEWQLKYFFEIQPKLNSEKIKMLFC